MSEDLTRTGMDETAETEGADEVAQNTDGGPVLTLNATVKTNAPGGRGVSGS